MAPPAGAGRGAEGRALAWAAAAAAASLPSSPGSSLWSQARDLQRRRHLGPA